MSESRLGFGTEPLGGCDWGPVDVLAITQAIDYALSQEINLFDTADAYGLGVSETRLGQILGVKRHDVTIISKGGVRWDTPQEGQRAKITKDNTPQYLQQACEDSLRRLDVDVIPIYLVHWPDNQTPLDEVFNKLHQLKQQGKIAQLGCSNFSLDQLKEVVKTYDIDAIQISHNLLNASENEEILTLCEEHHIDVYAYGILGQGLLTGKYHSIAEFPDDDRRKRLYTEHPEKFDDYLDLLHQLEDECRGRELTVSQLAIAKTLADPRIKAGIVGVKSLIQLRNSLEALRFIPSEK